MKLSDVTPEWVAEMRDALGLRNVDIYEAIGMEQSKFSKSMSGVRSWKVREREAIISFFDEASEAEKSPIASEILDGLHHLTEGQRAQVHLIVQEFSRLNAQTESQDHGSPESDEDSKT